MRRNSCTVVVLAGSAPGEVLAAVGRSMNVALIRPEDHADHDSDGLAAASAALQRAGRATSPYALVPADPLTAVAAGWQAMWDVSRQQGPAEFEQEALKVLTAWRAGRFELPDYYLVLATNTGAGDAADHGPDFYLGPLRSVRPRRIAFVAAAEPAQQAAGVLHALGSLRHGPWWPGLDEVIETARGFYPDSLAEGMPPQIVEHPSTLHDRLRSLSRRPGSVQLGRADLDVELVAFGVCEDHPDQSPVTASTELLSAAGTGAGMRRRGW